MTVTIAPPTSEAVYKPTTQEWEYTDLDGITYCGSTPGECYRQAAEGARVEAAHWARCDKHWANDPVHYQDDEGELQPCQAAN